MADIQLIQCKNQQPNFAALSRGRYLYSAGRPSRWASVHILVMAPYGIGQAIIFSSFGFFFLILSSFFLAYSQPSHIGCLHFFFMAAHNNGQFIIFCSCGFYLLLSFFLVCSQLSEMACLPYFHTLCGLSANSKCMSEMCCTRLAEIQDAKNRRYFAIWAPSHNYVGLYLRN